MGQRHTRLTTQPASSSGGPIASETMSADQKIARFMLWPWWAAKRAGHMPRGLASCCSHDKLARRALGFGNPGGRIPLLAGRSRCKQASWLSESRRAVERCESTGRRKAWRRCRRRDMDRKEGCNCAAFLRCSHGRSSCTSRRHLSRRTANQFRREVLACDGCDHTIGNRCRQFVRPLRHSRRRNPDGCGGLPWCSAKQADRFGFEHANSLAH